MVDITPILVGDRPGDGKGDLNRDAWIKANANAAALANAVTNVAGTVADLVETLPRAGATIPLTALGALPAGRFVAAAGQRQAVRATPAVLSAPTGRAIGYLETATPDGGALDARVSGQVSVPGASWGVGLPVYLADDGAPTVVPRTAGWSQVVGTTTGANTFAVALGPAGPVQVSVPTVAFADLLAVLPGVLTETVRALPLAPPAAPGTLWRSQGFVMLNAALDGAPYAAGSGPVPSGALDPVAALLVAALPRVLRALPSAPPASAGVLWRNGAFVVLTPGSDGAPYPSSPLPSPGAGLVGAVRTILPGWLAAAMPGWPLLPPISPGVPWRSQHRLALSL